MSRTYFHLLAYWLVAANHSYAAPCLTLIFVNVLVIDGSALAYGYQVMKQQLMSNSIQLIAKSLSLLLNVDTSENKQLAHRKTLQQLLPLLLARRHHRAVLPHIKPQS